MVDGARVGSEAEEEQALEAEVRDRAYQIYRERLEAGADGDELSDWARAEAEVRARRERPPV